jgi:hypothetical protein
MMTKRASRGRPLIALILLMTAWVGFRTAFWNSPAVSAQGTSRIAVAEGGDADLATRRGGGVLAGPQSLPGDGLFAFGPGEAGGPAPWAPYPARDMRWATRPPQRFESMQRRPMPREFPMQPTPWGWGSAFTAPPPAPAYHPAEAPKNRPVPVRYALAHQMLWMAATSHMPLPMDLLSSGAAGALAPIVPSAHGGGRRWSADAWLLLRKGGNVSLASGVLPATYGASQFGAVLRYRLAPHSRHRPNAYLRTTAALNGSQEKEVAVGISARPVARLPLAIAAEVRATDQPGFRHVRPAFLGWTEIAPFDLPFDARGEFYAQGGYIGGKFKTPFADGQLRIDRSMISIGRTELRAGGGAWAGVQKGASRVDVGPSATMGLPISRSASARLALDWRFRLAGNAEPKSGPAVTLSAGF